MSPLGHTALSCLGAKAARLPVVGAALGGLWPDVDFLLLPLASFNELHRTASHSLALVALGGAVFSLLARRPRRWFFLAFVLGGCLHLLVDACLDDNPTNGIGVALLWPFSDRAFSPVNLLEPDEETAGWDGPWFAWRYVWLVLAVEVPLAMAAAWVVLRGRRSRPT